jgi:hypothetical protein
MAQAMELAIPNASQLIFPFISGKNNTMQQCCKIFVVIAYSWGASVFQP